MFLLLACASPLTSQPLPGGPDPSGDVPGDSAPPDTGESAPPAGSATASVHLVSGDACRNPCTFSAQWTGDVASFRYEADGWLLGESDVDAPALTYTFSELGDRDVRVVALDATGAEVAEDHRVVAVSGPESPAMLGVWLWYVEGVDMTHAELAQRLAELGVGRIYIKVADGSADCGAWPELCDASVPATYRAAGVEPWAWAYVYPGSTTAQADALRRAAATGYAGYVLDIEVEFDGASSTLTDTLSAFADARDEAVGDGVIDGGWELRATTWGNPADHDMRVDIIDRYVDAHMPQTYVEAWGDAYMANAADWVAAGTCEYRSLGATKPIHHVASTEYGEMRPSQIDSFIQASGPETSIWRVPGGGTPTSIWDDWAAVDWAPTSFDAEGC